MGIPSFIRGVFSRAPERRDSLENPSTSLDDPDVWDAIVGGEEGHSAAGVRVGHERALRLSAVWRGVFLIANTVGKLPLYVYERDADDEGKHYAHEHPAYMLLRRKPNAEMTAFTFRQVVTAQAVLMGNGYAYIDRAGDGSPRELIPLPPGTCHPVRANGVLYYVYTAPNGGMDKLAATDVYHIRGPGLDGLCGMALPRKAKDSIGSGLAAQEYAARYFANGAEPRVIFETATKLGPDQRAQIKQMWQTMHAGLENAHKSGILENGVTIKSFGADPESSQLLETRKFSAIDIANWLHLPPHKLGETSRTAFASLEQENQSFLDDSIEPWLVQHEEQSFDKLLTEEEKRTESHTVEFMRLALMRADAAARSVFYNNAAQNGWMNADEIRARENLNPIPGGKGKIYFHNGNLVPVGSTPAKQNDPKADPEVDPNAAGAARAVLVDACRRMVRRLAVHAKKAAKSPESLAAWLGAEMTSDHRAVILETLSTAVAVCAAVNRRELSADDLVDDLLARFDTALRGAAAGSIDGVLSSIESDVPDHVVSLAVGN